MRLWRRGRHERAPEAPRGRVRRIGRGVLFIMPLVAAAVIALLATHVLGTRGQFQASITNTNNRVESARVGVSEPQGTNCDAEAGEVVICADLNKYNGVPVTITNTGNTAANLFLLPGACSDSLTGAGGLLCGQVTVDVSCTVGSTTTHVTENGPVSLNDFRRLRPTTGTPPTPLGYFAGQIPTGESTLCTFTLSEAAVTATGTVSQPIAVKLTLP